MTVLLRTTQPAQLPRHEPAAGPDPPPHAARSERFERVDVEAVRQRYPIEEVVARYGIDLRGGGRALVGHCPFHNDRRRPNLHVYRDTASYYCYRCGAWGDVIGFVQRFHRLGFRAAVERLAGTPPVIRPRRPCPPNAPRRDPAGRERECPPPRTAEEQACLSAAVQVYHRRLTAHARALAYLEGRSIDRRLVDRYHIGYCTGRDLLGELRRRGLSVEAAQRVGLLRENGSELLAGRVVVAEFRSGLPVWMVGRTIDDGTSDLKYLGLPGTKPLFGWEEACAAAKAGKPVVAVEGVFDRFTLARWGIAGLSFVGTRVRPAAMDALRQFRRLYLALDDDEGGHDGTEALVKDLGPIAAPVRLPAVPGVNDVADLGQRPDGRALFIGALRRAKLAAARRRQRTRPTVLAGPQHPPDGGEPPAREAAHGEAPHTQTTWRNQMAGSLNTVHLIGRLGVDPEMRFTGEGAPRTRLRLATDRPVRPGSEPQVDWHTIICWDALAERANEYLSTGRLVYVSGRLSYWNREADGQRWRVAEIVADSIIALDRRPPAAGMEDEDELDDLSEAAGSEAAETDDAARPQRRAA